LDALDAALFYRGFYTSKATAASRLPWTQTPIRSQPFAEHKVVPQH